MNLLEPDLTSCTHHSVKKTCRIIDSAYKSASSFYDLFCQSEEKRIVVQSDEKQDLLRAMLLFSSSGLDAAVKQLVQDTLDEVITKDTDASRQFEDYVEKRLKRSEIVASDKNSVIVDVKFLSKILTNSDPKGVLIEELKGSLREKSLQSVDQLLRVASFFAIEQSSIFNNLTAARQIFRTRNEITHEMDIETASRRSRSKDQMIAQTNTILSIATNFAKVVSQKLT